MRVPAQPLSGQPRVVVAFGDSITDGANSTADTDRRWPDRLDDRMQAAAHPRRPVSVVNAGLAGNRWVHDGVGPAGARRFQRDVLEVSGVTDVVIVLGINDIGIGWLYPPQQVNAGQLIAALRGAIDQARQLRTRVYLGTLLPYVGATYFDAALRDPDRPTYLHPRFDSGDHLHPKDAGHEAMAEAAARQGLLQ